MSYFKKFIEYLIFIKKKFSSCHSKQALSHIYLLFFFLKKNWDETSSCGQKCLHTFRDVLSFAQPYNCAREWMLILHDHKFLPASSVKEKPFSWYDSAMTQQKNNNK